MKTAKLMKCANSIFWHKGLRGGIVFIGLIMGGCWLLTLKGMSAFIDSYFTTSFAALASFLLNFTGFNVAANGITLAGHGLSVQIKYGCNAVYETMVFYAAVIAYPARIKHRIIGIIAGTVIIYLLNLIRIIFLFLTGAYFPRVFEITHEQIAQNFFIFILVVLWLLWIAKAKRDTAA